MKITRVDGHVGAIEIFCLVSMMIHIKMFLALPRDFVREAANAAWLLPIIGALVMAFAFWIMERLRDYFEGASLLSIVESLWGKTIKWLIGLTIVCLVLILLALQLRIFGEIMITTILSKTPLTGILIPTTCLLIYLAYGGIENLARTAWILFPWALGLFLISIVMEVGQGDLFNLSPWLGYGVSSTLSSGIQAVSIYKEIFLLSFIAPLFRKQQTFRQVGYSILFFSCFAFVLVEIAYLMTFPIAAAEEIGFPIYRVNRLVKAGFFFQRVEAIFIFVWATVSLLGLAGGLYSGALALAQCSDAPDYRPFLFPLALVLIALTLLPESVIIANDFYSFLNKVSTIPLLLLPLALLIWTKLFIRPKKCSI